MRVLPLHQPYASLIAIGAKRVETRNWPIYGYLIGERVAIHACKTKEELWRVQTQPFLRRLKEAHDAGRLAMVDGELPLGAIVATAVVHRCRPITPESALELLKRDPDEHAFGGYDTSEEPRFAWVLRDVEPFERPIPFSAHQGIATIDDALLGAAVPYVQESLL